MKQCFKCNAVKPLDAFYRHPGTADGHLGKCKDCTRQDVKQNYRATVENKREYDRLRYQQSERHASALAQSAKHAQRNPEKARARSALQWAVHTGRITKGPCEVCGTTIKVEAHHEDYSKPLDVRWLCFYHHRETHGALVTPAPF
jgi:hypothetical protein